MTWLTWRQFRVQAWAALGGLTVVAVALALTGPRLAHLYDTSGLATCAAANTCAVAQQAFAGGVKANDLYPLVFFAGIAILYLMPAVIGMFWGAPLVARELEAGTFRLAWSQTVTRAGWLATKLGLVGLVTVLAAGILSLAVTWWSGPIDRADGLPAGEQGVALPNHFVPLIFGARDIVPIGYAAFAFALGLGAGILVRRTVPAMGVTLAVLAAVQVIVPVAVRAHYVGPAQVSTPLVLDAASPQSIGISEDQSMTVSEPVSIAGAWIVSVRTVDAAGEPFTGPAPATCLSTTSSPEECDAAINDLHLRQLVTYQPGNRYWTFQRYEAALYLVLTLGLVGLCVWRIRRLRLN